MKVQVRISVLQTVLIITYDASSPGAGSGVVAVELGCPSYARRQAPAQLETVETATLAKLIAWVAQAGVISAPACTPVPAPS